MEGHSFLQDLAVVMIVAGIVTLVFHRLRQPVVLGYMLAGLIIGPHTPPYPLIHDQNSIQTLSELGIIFLMFSLGLEFNLRKLKQVGLPALIAAVLEILLMLGAGYQLGQWFGWSRMDSLFLGAILSISSTTIIIKALSELGLTKERFAGLIFGILIIEDILAIVLIALLSGIATSGSLGLFDIGITLTKLSVFLVTALVLGLLFVPRLLGYVNRFRSDEMLLVTVLALCFGFSMLAVRLGYSVALGAFVMGAIISEAREIGKIERLAEPLRDTFSAVFFVSIGMMIDPRMLVEHALPILIITLAVVICKVIACAFGTFVSGVDARTSLRVGMGLAQIGEFSFIIAGLGITLNVTSSFLYPIAVAVSVVTTLLTPYLLKWTDAVVNRASRLAPQSATHTLRLYTRWVDEVRRAGPRYPGLRPVRSVVFQIALNVTLIAGAFTGAALLARPLPHIFPVIQRIPGGAGSICWTLAVIVTLPVYVATIRKMQALGMMLSEITIPGSENRWRAGTLSAVVAHMLFAIQVLALGILTLVLSSATLPPHYMLFALMAIALLIAVIFGRQFNRLYSRAKFALVETWTSAPPPPRPVALPSLLADAEMETVVIGRGPAAGRLIRELALRTTTGASIVALERKGQTIVNPGPDEELQEHDRVLLIGDRSQLIAASAVITNHIPET